MRHPLGTVLPTVLLAVLLTGLTACGDDSGTVADDPPRSATPTPSSSDSPGGDDRPGPGDPVEFELVTTLTETAARGDVSTEAVPLPDDPAVQQFVAAFTEPLQASVEQAVAGAAVPDDMQLYGAVVNVGCDAPDQVQVVENAGALQVIAEKVPDPKRECFAPMTTVALVLVPASAVG
ncbi:hypothetical protein G5V58_01155 [Nocardioides anomalus]|uniref:Lipoprotein n=1 Tax=Nocardioides anomalus TaxID=2712223 RepID=A0A6G6W8L6_9ACTN|nr:hypothetical protein [Nocardioides anomalus]QIG41562.1 hypothetical protein G5V58_01155 [Nocardioides anomalus]